MKAYREPGLYSASAIAGLVLALLTEGVGDALGLTLLAIPLCAIAVRFVKVRER